MTPWTFNVKFSYDIEFTFGSLTFVAGEDENLKLLTLGSAPERLTTVYGQTPCLPVISSTSYGSCSDLDPYAGSYIRIAKIVRDITIMMSILQPSAGALSSFSSTVSSDQDSADDYLEIGESTCWDSIEKGRLIIMVAPA
jgi:hypothetical protein